MKVNGRCTGPLCMFLDGMLPFSPLFAVGWLWGTVLSARSWDRAFPGPSASGTAGCETLMNFNLGLGGRETDGMTQLETQWIAYWLPMMWFGIFQRYDFPVFVILNECPLLCSASGASVQLPGCCVRFPWCFRAASLIHSRFIAVSLAESTAERSFQALRSFLPSVTTTQRLTLLYWKWQLKRGCVIRVFAQPLLCRFKWSWSNAGTGSLLRGAEGSARCCPCRLPPLWRKHGARVHFWR